MGELRKSAERYAIAGARAILATVGLKKVLEQIKDTPGRRSVAYKAVIKNNR